MIKIKNGSDIHYPAGDTFQLSIGREVPFGTGDMLRLQIVKTEGSTPFIENKYDLNSSGEFDVILSESDKNKLKIGERYIYRLSVIDVNGNVDTETSGNLVVEWGV